MSDANIVIGITGDDSGGRVIKRSLDDIVKSSKQAAVSTEYFKRELSSGQVTIQKFTEKMTNAGQSAKVIQTEVKRLGINQRETNAIIKSAQSPLERLQAEQAKYNKYLAAGAIDQQTYAKATANNKQNLAQLASQSSVTGKAVQQLGYYFGAFLGAAAIKNAFALSDQFTMMRGRVQNITKDVGETNKVMQSLMKTANDTGQGLDAGLSVFQRLSQVRTEIGATNAQMLQFTDTVSKLGVISGASPEALKNGLTQLGQALSNSKIRAEEFNSIMENTPAIGNEIAKQFGITTGQLGILVRTGKVDAVDAFNAMLAASKDVNDQFDKMPRTIAQASAAVTNELGVAFSALLGESGATTGVVKALDSMTPILKDITAGIQSMGASFEFIGNTAQAVFHNVGWYFQNMMNGVKLGLNDLTRDLPTPFRTDFKPDLVGGNMELPSLDALRRKQQDFARVASGAMGPINKAVTGPTEAEKAALKTKYGTLAGQIAPPKSAADKAAESAAKKAAREALQEQKKQQNELQSAIKGSRTEQEKLNDEIAHLEQLKGVAKTAQEVELLNRGIRNTQAELEKVRLKVEMDSPMAKAFKGIADEVQDGFKDAFKGAFDGGGSMFKKMADGIKATFKSLLLDLAYQAAVRPIVVSVLGGIGGSMGLSSAATAASLGEAGGGLGSLLSGGSSLLSMGKSLFNGGVGTSLGNFAGKASSFLGGSFNTNMNVQKFFTNAGSFGNIAGGFAGGLGANLLGLGNKNGIVNGVTGTLGGLAGSAFGPIGSAVGSFLGTALGGLFGGGKPSDMGQVNKVDFATGERSTYGSMTGKKFSQANADYARSVIDEAVKLADMFKQAGAKVSGNLGVYVGSRDGLRLGFGKDEKNFGNNSAAFQNAVMQKVVDGTTGLNFTFSKILNVLGTGNTTKLAEGFAFGQQYEEFLKTAEAIDPVTQAFKDLSAQFDPIILQAHALGLPVDKLTEIFNKQKFAAMDNAKAQQAGFDSLKSMNAAFKDFFNGQALGSNSSLNPMEKLKLAQNDFGGLLSKAQGGDLSVTQELLSSANQLIGMARNTYASGASFVGIEKFVRSSVQGVATQAGVTGLDSTAVMANNVVQSNQVLVDTVKALLEENIKMRKAFESLRNQLSVAS